MATTPLLETMEIGIATDVGCKRGINEDTVLGQLLIEGAQNPWQLSALIAVADGMGGNDAGEVASQLAGDTVRRIFASDQSEVFPIKEVSGQNLLKRLREAVQYINQEVHQIGAGEGDSHPGTTLTLCLIRPHEYCIGHVGDSRAYLIRPETIEQVTEDDSYVAEMVRRGKMTEEEAQNSKFSNIITKAIGLQADVEPSVYYGQWQAGDVLLVCSDGLSGYMPKASELLELVQRYATLQEVCDECIRLAKERGGHDNISVAAARNMPPADAAISPIHKAETWPPAGAPPDMAKIPAEILQEADNKKRDKPRNKMPIAWDRKQIVRIVLVILVLVIVGLVGFMFGSGNGKTSPGSKEPGITIPKGN